MNLWWALNFSSFSCQVETWSPNKFVKKVCGLYQGGNKGNWGGGHVAIMQLSCRAISSSTELMHFHKGMSKGAPTAASNHQGLFLEKWAGDAPGWGGHSAHSDNTSDQLHSNDKKQEEFKEPALYVSTTKRGESTRIASTWKHQNKRDRNIYWACVAGGILTPGGERHSVRSVQHPVCVPLVFNQKYYI